MAQTNYTPIQLYYSSTASAVPVNTNLASGELAINITDGLLFYKDNAGTVQKIGYKLTPTTAGGTGLTSFTANGIVYASSTSALATNSALTFDGTYFGVGSGNASMKVGADGANNFQIFNGALTPDGTNFALEQNYLGTNTILNAASGGQLLFRIGNSNNAVLTSTGLGIGTSSPAYKLVVAGTAPRIVSQDTTSNYITVLRGGNTLGYVGTESNIPFAIVTNGNTAATFDTSGNLGLGVTPSAWDSGWSAIQVSTQGASFVGRTGGNEAISLSNAYRNSASWKYITSTSASMYQCGNGIHTWFIAPSGTAGNAITFTQAMTLDSSGNLLVNTTSAVTTTVGSRLMYGATDPYISSTLTSSSNATTSYLLYSTGAAAYRFYVGMGGTVYATNTTISAISDQRLKENIRDLDDGLASVMALKPRKFDWKEGKGANIKDARGFIAQEFETVFPDMIDEWKDPAPEGEEPYKAINANLIPTLVKAMQEQQAIIQSLTARITALEGA